MKEITRIITARITLITQKEKHKKVTEDGKREVAKMICNEMGFDDVVIDEVQDFVREVEE